jgi:hypothetical protein
MFSMRIRTAAATALLLSFCVVGLARAANPEEVVRWTASVSSVVTITRGGAALLELSGEIQDGWHVYGPDQHAGGPTPLQITLDANALAAAAGPTFGTAPEKVHDSHFGFDTQLYTHPFVVRLPLRLGTDLAAGRQLIPVSVRFQACSDRECLLPRTVHLSVPIDVSATG